MIELVTVATRPAGYFEALLESAVLHGYEPVILGMGQEWKGFGTKLNLYHEHLRGITDPKRLVLLVDAHDVLIVRPCEALEEAFARLGAPVIASAEKLCYPDPWKESYFPRTESPWRFLNSGAILGEAQALLALFDEHQSRIRDDTDDQRWWTDCYFCDQVLTRRRRILLDTGCEALISAYDSLEDLELGAEIRNKLTGSRPCVIHGNGGVDLDSIVAWIRGRGQRV